ncbi:MAG: hypothetical protein M3425_04960 [Actinomycetota bacterium]|nr:hypothetical protein [Actinomycetota bacterium]
MSAGVLADLELLKPPDSDTLILRRAWPRGPDHLLLDYAHSDGRRVAAQWFGTAGGRPDRERLMAVAAETDRVARGLGEVVAMPDVGVLLQHAGADRRLPALGGLADQGQLVVHRPERRAVVHLDDAEGDRYAKVVRPGRLQGLLAAGALAEASGAFITPRLLDADADAGVAVSAALPGRSLFELLDSPRLIPAMSAAGEALARFHATDVAEASLAHHTAADEVTVVNQWIAHCRTFAPAAAAAAESHLHTLMVAMVREPATHRALAHRDCYDKQLLDSGDGRCGMVDLDTLALAEPSLDLANVLVHLELRVAQGVLDRDRAQDAAAALVAGYHPDAAVRGRVPAYATASRLRLACLYALRPGWRHLTSDLLDRVAARTWGLDG